MHACSTHVQLHVLCALRERNHSYSTNAWLFVLTTNNYCYVASYVATNDILH